MPAEKANWTDERVELLKKLWTEGQSASQIAGRLGGGVTRNAVVGKVHRLGLEGRGHNYGTRAAKLEDAKTPIERQRILRKPKAVPSMLPIDTKPTEAYQPTLVALPAPEPVPVPIPLQMGQRVTVLNLSDKTCKWPIGEPGSEDFCFCGHGPRDGSPYCEYHVRLAYQPLHDRRNRRVAFG